MFKSLFILVAAILFSCQNETVPSPNIEKPEKVETLSEDDFEKQMEMYKLELAEMMEDSDSIRNSLLKPFSPFKGVDRKENSENLNFETKNWEGLFEYLYPGEPTFEKNEKSDHITYSARKLVSGLVYEITIEDYEELGADKIDGPFTKFIHNSYIEHVAGDIKADFELKTASGVYGYSSCYSHDLGGTIFLTDLVSYGFKDKMVRLSVTAKVQFENANRVQEFVDGFVLL